MKKRVVVGLSGGVDSSVASYLLKEQGYDVIGIFMKNWYDSSVTISNECPWIDDSNDALQVAQSLQIPFQTINLSQVYKEQIVDYMFSEYQNGRTPNPDILCNKKIKFDAFLQHAMALDADFIATGHYCRKSVININGKTIYQLLSGKDKNKDQSYFLCQLKEQQLQKVLFPIGELKKHQVRAIAKKLNLITAHKKDSQGLCFVGRVKLPVFLQQKLKPKKGNIIEISSDLDLYSCKDNISLDEKTSKINYKPIFGKIIGIHNGAHFYTIGQRKGLNIGGTDEPLFVIDIDTVDNIVYVGKGKSHLGLYRKGLRVKTQDVHWLRNDLKLQNGEYKEYDVRFRYRQKLFKAMLYQTSEYLHVEFETSKRGISSGQFIAWYNGDEMIGSGVIF